VKVVLNSIALVIHSVMMMMFSVYGIGCVDINYLLPAEICSHYSHIMSDNSICIHSIQRQLLNIF
jgi:hypothetical protein